MRSRKDKVDANQKDIVDALRKIPGITVEVGHDDILCGCYDKLGIPRTYWYEIKNPDKVSTVTGKVQPSAVRKSQKNIVKKWCGHYKIVCTLDEILIDMNLKGG